MNKKWICVYLRQVRSWLPCSAKEKKRILEELRQNVTAFVQETPESTLSHIEERFGKPQDIAASYVHEMALPELLRTIRIRRRIITAVVAAVCAALLVWAVGLSCAVIDDMIQYPGYVEYGDPVDLGNVTTE